MTWAAISFSMMDAEDQFRCVRRLKTEGMGLHDIAAITGWQVCMIEHALNESTPARVRYEDWERQQRTENYGPMTPTPTRRPYE